MCQGFSSRGFVGVAFVGRDLGLPHIRESQLQTASKQIFHWPKLNSSATLLGPLLITCLQKGNSAAGLRDSSEKKGNKTTLKSLRSVKEQEEVLHENQEIAAFGEHHSDLIFFSPGAPWRIMVEQTDIHTQPVKEPAPEQVDVPWRMLQLTESLQRKKLPAGAAACGQEPTKEEVLRQELQPVGGPCWSSLLLKNWAPWKGPMLTQFLKELQSMEGTHWAWGWRRGFSFGFASCSPTLFLIYKKLNSSSSIQVCFAHDSESEPSVLILMHETLLPHHIEDREWLGRHLAVSKG